MVTNIINNNRFMTGVLIAHDCQIGSNNIFVNQVTVGGHVNILDNIVIVGLSAVIQFVTIGSHTMIGGMSGIDKNVLPFSLVMGNRAILRGLNLVGIRRNKFSKEEISRINEIHKSYISGYKDFDDKNLLDLAVFLSNGTIEKNYFCNEENLKNLIDLVGIIAKKEVWKTDILLDKIDNITSKTVEIESSLIPISRNKKADLDKILKSN